MHGEMLHNHTIFNQVVEFELFLQRLYHDELLLTRVELLEELGGVVLERQLYVELLHARLNLEHLSHVINLRVIKVDDHSDQIFSLRLLLEVTYLLDLIV